MYHKKVLVAPIAQLVEQIPLKDKVVGSIPTGRTREKIVTAYYFFIRVRTGAMFLQQQKRARSGSEEILF